MQFLLQTTDVGLTGSEIGLQRRQQLFRLRDCGFQAALRILAVLNLDLERIDLALAQQHRMQGRLLAMETHAIARHHMPGLAHNELARFQLIATRQGLGAIGHGIHAMQPIGDTAAALAFPAHIMCERREGMFGSAFVQAAGTAGHHRHCGRRRIAHPLRGGGDIVHHHGIDAVAQHAFQRDIPAGLDFQALPQARQVRELMLVEPGLELLVLIQVALHLRQRLHPRFQPRQMLQMLLHLARGFAHGALGLGLALMLFGIAFTRGIQASGQFQNLCLLRGQQGAIRTAQLRLLLL